MHQEERADILKKQLLDMRIALHNLRDGLVGLSLTLQDFSFQTDENAQRKATMEVNDLLARIRN